MPGALTWDPTPAGGSLSTARGEQNPSADGASLSSTEVALTRALVSTPGNPNQPGPAVSFFSATGGGSGLVADGVPAPWAVALHAPLTSGCESRTGPQPTAARDSAYSTPLYVVDHEGLMVKTLAGEIVSWGARRERQLCRYTEQLSFAGTDGWSAVNGCSVVNAWDDNAPSTFYGASNGRTVWKITAGAQANSVLRSLSAYVLDPVPHTFAVKLRADTPHQAEIRLYISGGATLATKVVDVTTSWQTFYVTGTPDGTSAYAYSIAPATWAGAAGGVVYAVDPQLHERVGSTTAPPEYIARDSYPVGPFWLGAGVDGVAYFNTTNANTLNASTGVVTAVAGTALTTVRGVATGPSYQQVLDTRWANWTLTGAGSITTGLTGPNGKASAIKLVEDTSTGAHHLYSSLIGSSAYGSKWATISVCAKQAGASDRAWIRLYLLDINGSSSKNVYLNIATGAVGTTSGTVYVEVEPLGSGWFRFHMTAQLGTGANNAVMRVYSCTADNTPTHTGDITKGVLLAFPNASTALSAGGADRAIPCPYADNAATAAAFVPGQHISYPIKGLLGRTDFGVVSTVTPYYKPSRPKKGGESQNYSAVTYIRCGAPTDTISTYGDFDTCRTGLTIRHNGQGTTHYSKWAYDLYCGNPNKLFVWKASTAYAVGDIVIPTDTAPNNDNARRMFTCVVAGTSGASEPSWNSTYTATPDTVTNITTDGSVKWQVNEPNGISGLWEPYLGAHLVPPADTFMATLKCGWFVQATTYGCFMNGVENDKQTLKQLQKGMPTVLPYKPKTLWLGQMGSNKGVPGAANGGAPTDAELMGVYWHFHRDLVVWNTSPTTDAVLAATV